MNMTFVLTRMHSMVPCKSTMCSSRPCLIVCSGISLVLAWGLESGSIHWHGHLFRRGVCTLIDALRGCTSFNDVFMNMYRAVGCLTKPEEIRWRCRKN
ncbi:hypothetical protein C8Q70DRAFT_991264 [Cubamyces menziesii]|nr:hypothetical protein C8Q70DRAFT_991264 [Cubamyces menziesii]